MIDRFLDQQKRKLEEIGSEKQRHWQQSELERNPDLQLPSIHDQLGHGPEKNALFHQNRPAMRQQLSVLLESQEQEVALAKLALDQKQQQLLNQFRKVKGLEIYQKKWEKQLKSQQKRKEQLVADDWLMQRHRGR